MGQDFDAIVPQAGSGKFSGDFLRGGGKRIQRGEKIAGGSGVAVEQPFFREQSANSYDFKQGFDYRDLIGPDEFTRKVSPEVTSIALQRARQLKGRKFFLYLMYADTHSPHTQHPEFVFGSSRKDALGPRWASSLAVPFQNMSWARLERLLTSPPTDRQLGADSRESRLARYNSEIAYTDHAIGDLFAGLKSLGLYDDSLIICCADHGEEFLEHGRYGHQLTLYHEVTDVPLLIKFPRQQHGTVIGGKFPLIDLYPSIMALLHGNCAHLGVQGDSIDLPALLRCTDKPIFGATVRDVRSVLSGQYKYYKSFKSARKGSLPLEDGLAFLPSQPTDQLFDMRKDPGEYRSIFSTTPGVGSSLIDLLHRHDAYLQQTDTLSGPVHPTSSTEEEQLRQRLHGLGYLQE